MQNQAASLIPETIAYITRRQLATMTHRTVQGLALLAMQDKGPPVYRPTGKKGHVLYRLDQVIAWIEGSAE